MGFGDLLKQGQQLSEASNLINQLSGSGENKSSSGGNKINYADYAEDAKDAYTAFSGEGAFQDKAQRAFKEISANHSGQSQQQEEKKDEEKKD